MTTTIILRDSTYLKLLKRHDTRYEKGLATFNPDTKAWSVPIDDFTLAILDVYRHEDETYDDALTRALGTRKGKTH